MENPIETINFKESIYELITTKIASRLSDELSRTIESDVQVDFISSDFLRLEELLNTLKPNPLIGIMDIQFFKTSGAILLEKQVLHVLDTEDSKQLINLINLSFNLSFPLTNVDSQITELISNPQEMNICELNQPVVVSSFEIKSRVLNGWFYIILPTKNLGKYLDNIYIFPPEL